MEGMTELQAALIGAEPHILLIVALLLAGLAALFVVFIVGAMMCVGGGRERDATAGGMTEGRFRQHSATIEPAPLREPLP